MSSSCVAAVAMVAKIKRKERASHWSFTTGSEEYVLLLPCTARWLKCILLADVDTAYIDDQGILVAVVVTYVNLFDISGMHHHFLC